MTFRSDARPARRAGDPVGRRPRDRPGAASAWSAPSTTHDQATTRWPSTGLLDRDDQPIGDRRRRGRSRHRWRRRKRARDPVARDRRRRGALAFALVLALFWSRRLGAPIARAPPRRDRGVARRSRPPDRRSGRRRARRPRGRVQPDDRRRSRTTRRVSPRACARSSRSTTPAARCRRVIDLDQVSRKIVDAVARTFDVQLAALWLAEGGDGELRASAARARRSDVSSALATDEALAAAEPPAADRRARARRSRGRCASVKAPRGRAVRRRRARRPGPPARSSRCRSIARTASSACSRSARAEAAREFSEADLNLLTTFADQAGAAVENARALPRGPRRERGARAARSGCAPPSSPRSTASSGKRARRSAGDPGAARAVGAHGRPRPAGRRRRARDQLADRGDPRLDRWRSRPQLVARRAARGRARARARPRRDHASYLESIAPALAERPLATGLAARRAAKELAAAARRRRAAADRTTSRRARRSRARPRTMPRRFVAALGEDKDVAPRMVAALTDHVYLQRTASTVRHAVGPDPADRRRAEELLPPRPAGDAYRGRSARGARDHARAAPPRAA